MLAQARVNVSVPRWLGSCCPDSLKGVALESKLAVFDKCVVARKKKKGFGCCVFASEGSSATQTKTVGLLEKQKTDAWLKYGREAPAQKPVEKPARWVRPGYKESGIQQPIDRSGAQRAQGYGKRSKQRAIAAIQQAADPAEVNDILERLGTTGLRVSMFAELIKMGDVDHSKQVNMLRLLIFRRFLPKSIYLQSLERV